jgi:histone H4
MSGKGGGKRHRKVLRENIKGITKPAIRRLCRRGGVKRIAGAVYEEIRGVLTRFLEGILRDTLIYAQHNGGRPSMDSYTSNGIQFYTLGYKGRRKTVNVNDVLYALKRQDRTFYT